MDRAKMPEVTALFLAGDLTNGNSEDYAKLKEVLENSDSARYYLVVGNHDLFYNGWETYYAWFGSSTYLVKVITPEGSDLLICLDTGGGTLGERQLAWLKEVLRTQRYLFRNCIVVTHSNFFRTHITESTNPLVEEIEVLLELFCTYQVNMVIMGHDHQRSTEVFGPTTFLTLDGLSDGSSGTSFLELTVKNGIPDYQFISR